MKILVKGPNLDDESIILNEDTPVSEVLKEYRHRMPYPIFACKVNNSYRGLTHLLHRDS